MSFMPRQIQWDKHCFVYCGDGKCDCGASASPMQYEEHKRELAERRARLEEKKVVEENFNKGLET